MPKQSTLLHSQTTLITPNSPTFPKCKSAKRLYYRVIQIPDGQKVPVWLDSKGPAGVWYQAWKRGFMLQAPSIRALVLTIGILICLIRFCQPSSITLFVWKITVDNHLLYAGDTMCSQSSVQTLAFSTHFKENTTQFNNKNWNKEIFHINELLNYYNVLKFNRG